MKNMCEQMMLFNINFCPFFNHETNSDYISINENFLFQQTQEETRSKKTSVSNLFHSLIGSF